MNHFRNIFNFEEIFLADIDDTSPFIVFKNITYNNKKYQYAEVDFNFSKIILYNLNTFDEICNSEILNIDINIHG